MSLVNGIGRCFVKKRHNLGVNFSYSTEEVKTIQVWFEFIHNVIKSLNLQTNPDHVIHKLS